MTVNIERSLPVLKFERYTSNSYKNMQMLFHFSIPFSPVHKTFTAFAIGDITAVAYPMLFVSKMHIVFGNT